MGEHGQGDARLAYAEMRDLIDRTILEAAVLRDSVFELGSDELIELADAMLVALGQTAAECRAALAKDAGALGARPRLELMRSTSTFLGEVAA